MELNNAIPDGFAQGGRLRRLAVPLTWAVCRWTAAVRMLPGFIIIGAQKSGTTSLCTQLFRHPQVRAPRRKEIHFFDSPEYANGMSWYGAHFPLQIARASGRSSETAKQITGEASPYYLCHPHAPRRVFEVLPNVKLIVMLRNPVDRALSHYNHQVRMGREPLTFEQAIDAEPERLAGERERMISDPDYYSYEWWAHSYLARGRYAEQLELWGALFRPEQMLVIRSEDYFNDPRAEFMKTLDFLELDRFDLESYGKQNVGDYDGMSTHVRQKLGAYFQPRNKLLYELLARDFGWD